MKFPLNEYTFAVLCNYYAPRNGFCGPTIHNLKVPCKCTCGRPEDGAAEAALELSVFRAVSHAKDRGTYSVTLLRSR